MSIATLDLARQTAPAPTQTDFPVANTNLLVSALRRWPLLLLGMICGGALGYLAYTMQAPSYISDAQVQVTKKATANSEGRAGYFEDYISGQIDRLRSDRILGQAAKSTTLAMLQNRLPEDNFQAYQAIKRGFVVGRSREMSAGAVGISPVLNLSYTCLNPDDCQLILNAIIKAYVDDITRSFTAETREKLNLNKINTDRAIKKKDSAVESLSNAKAERYRITTEEPQALQSRVTANREKSTQLFLEIGGLKRDLKLIEEAGPNRENRLAVLRLLGFSSQLGADTNQNSPEINLRALEAMKKEKFERGLGKDHPEIKSIDSQIAYWKEVKDRLNPDIKEGKIDELNIVEKTIRRKLGTAEENKVQIDNLVAKDDDDFKKSSALSIQIQSLQFLIDDQARTINLLEQERAKIESTETIGGFTAEINNPPQRGGKISPVMSQWTGLGVFLGLLLGFGLSLLVELSDKSFRSPAEIRQRLGVPVIGHSPFIRADLPSEADVPEGYAYTLVAARRPKSIEAEAYRGVRTQLSVITQNEGHQVIQVTSPNPGDGKSTFAANLAISIAQSGKKCVLLDCDFRKPRVHKLFDISKPELGLASVTSGLANLTQAIRHSSVDNLDILPCGPRPANPAELLAGPRFQQVLADLRGMYDYVIVDTPPMLAVSDPRVVAQRVDGVILVFKITKRARPLAERAREQLGDMGANLLGVIVNGSGNKNGDDYGYSYGYNYAYSYEYEYAETYTDSEEIDLTPAPTKRKRS